MIDLFVRSGASFAGCGEVLIHIGNETLAGGVVHDIWLQALTTREAELLTGVMLQQHATAIPYCEAVHTKSSATYPLRSTNKVHS